MMKDILLSLILGLSLSSYVSVFATTAKLTLNTSADTSSSYDIRIIQGAWGSSGHPKKAPTVTVDDSASDQCNVRDYDGKHKQHYIECRNITGGKKIDITSSNGSGANIYFWSTTSTKSEIMHAHGGKTKCHATELKSDNGSVTYQLTKSHQGRYHCSFTVSPRVKH